MTASLLAAAELRVEVGQALLPGQIHDLADAAVRRHARQTALLGRAQLERWAATGRLRTPFALPLRVVLTRNGVPLPAKRGFLAVGGNINPVFDTVGTRVFPAGYRTMLESVFSQAVSTMNVVFGQPAVAGDVHVRNYDADIQDRYAVAGGYYIPNGPDGPEIRFPVYNDTEVAAPVNYIHCLLLAYQGLSPYPFDAVEEGFVRAATMRVVRTPNALPGNPPISQIEATLDSLYDVSAFYDWYNQPALGCRDFIAPNLLNTSLPPGGSTGGVYLIRYLMAGTAWSKVSTEYPAFFPTFNALYYASPASYQTMQDLVLLGQQVIDTLAGGTGTIEGFSFVPIGATGGTSDFGVFAIDCNAFKTAANGDESLLAGTAYPIYWRPDFTRFFAAVQDDTIQFAGAYGSVVPNFVGTQFGGEQYRVAVDVPFLGANTRVVLPAGSFSTGGDPFPTRNFIGTLTGLPDPGGVDYEVAVEWIGGSQSAIPVQNFAFGFRITDQSFNNAQPVTVRVFQGAVELFSRRVNKGVGALALNLCDPDSDTVYGATIGAQLDMIGVPLQPYRVRPTSVFGTTDGQTLFAHWNPTFVRYDLFPDAGQVMAGQGYFLRLPTLSSVLVSGYSPPKTPMSTALQPGWNTVSVPFAQTIGTANVTFTVATEALSTYAESLGTIIGNTVFEFVPNGGNPDAGTMLPATSFEPGKGYMVRALRPEGAVMVFTPTDFPLNRGPQPMGPPGPAEQKWETMVEFSNARGNKTHVIVGQSSLTVPGFDPVRDSELPPSPGGFQSAILADRALYKDVGLWDRQETFTVRMSGLTRGERFLLQVKSLVGSKTLWLYDPVRNRYERLTTSSGKHYFNATSTTQTFLIVAKRGS
jgi:hypothetical protein